MSEGGSHDAERKRKENKGWVAFYLSRFSIFLKVPHTYYLFADLHNCRGRGGFFVVAQLQDIIVPTPPLTSWRPLVASSALRKAKLNI